MARRSLDTAEAIRLELEETYYLLKKIYLDGKQYIKPTEAKALLYATAQIHAVLRLKTDEELLAELRKLENGGNGNINLDAKMNEQRRKAYEEFKTRRYAEAKKEVQDPDEDE